MTDLSPLISTLCQARYNDGRKQHDGGPDDWQGWGPEDFAVNMAEEIADSIVYAEEYLSRAENTPGVTTEEGRVRVEASRAVCVLALDLLGEETVRSALATAIEPAKDWPPDCGMDAEEEAP